MLMSWDKHQIDLFCHLIWVIHRLFLLRVPYMHFFLRQFVVLINSRQIHTDVFFVPRWFWCEHWLYQVLLLPVLAALPLQPKITTVVHAVIFRLHSELNGVILFTRIISVGAFDLVSLLHAATNGPCGSISYQFLPPPALELLLHPRYLSSCCP